MFKTKVVVVFTSLFVSSGCGEPEIPPLLGEVESKKFVYKGSFRGEFEAAVSTPVHVPNFPGGAAMTIDFVAEDGTVVKEGDVILRFVKDTIEADLRNEKNTLDVAKSEMDRVRHQQSKEGIDLALTVKRRELELKRSEMQIVQGVNFISDLELKKAEIDVAKSKIELELAKKAQRSFRLKKATSLKIESLKVNAAERNVDERKKGLGMIDITAPVEGVIYAPQTRLNWQRTKALPGVVARAGDKVLEIPDLSTFEVHLYARQRDASLISVGDPLTVVPTIFPERTIKGKVKKKEEFATTRNERLGTDTPDGNLKEFLIIAELESSPKELKPGNTGKVTIESVVSETALLVPIAAIGEDEKGSFLTSENGKKKRVKIGRSNLTHAEVLEGATAGERVQLDLQDKKVEVDKPKKKRRKGKGGKRKGKR